MATKTIRHAGFRYSIPVTDKDGKPVVRHDGKPAHTVRIAARGETVDIPLQEDIDRGDRLGAFVVVDTDNLTALSELNDEELQTLIRDQKPTATQLIDAVGDDAVLAQRVVAAEVAVNGDSARKAVVEPLQKLSGSE